MLRGLWQRGLLLALAAWLAACGSLPPASAPVSPQAQEVVLYSLSLLDTGYRFGGKNPEAGLDCSGMVSYIFGQAAGVKVAGSAADIARRGRQVEKEQLRPGDLVFFNTLGRTLSHVGIYLGDGRFIHAPSSHGKVRVDRLDARYYAERFETARSYFE
jgi:cell wall-associated NlpC family hydrolase